MKYNFDTLIDRKNTNCLKYDLLDHFFGKTNILPMWIADMDIAIPDFVINAVKKRAEHPMYGYTTFSEDYYQNFINWIYKRHGVIIEKEWICFSPGVVPALNLSVLTYTNKNDKIIIQPPIYPPFFSAIKDHDRVVIENNLQFCNGNFCMDFEDLESKIDSQTSMIILCNPHNPGGRCWKKEELEKLIHICHKNNITIISDEIHSDLIRCNHRHTSMLSLTDKTISCFSPSKTFNLAGMSTSFIVIPDKEMREKYLKTLQGLHIAHGNLFGSIATETAYGQGEEWYIQVWNYLQNNIDYAIDYCKKHIPTIDVVAPEATYLLWLDCRKISTSHEILQDIFVNKLKLGLNNGIEFGNAGEGFMRMNVACPRQTLEIAMDRLKEINTFATNN